MADEPLPALPPILLAKGFVLKEKVGDGGFAKVYRATWTQKPGDDIAAKIIELKEADQTWVVKNLKNEMKILKRMNHKNITRVYEMIKTSTFAYIFMEFARNGNVMELIQKTDRPLPEPKAKKFMKDITSGLAHCHRHGIAHRDIKPENFLIDHNEKVMLSDFGFACTTLTKTDVKIMKGTACGTSEYKAIEIRLLKDGEAYDAKATDLYSLGISLFLMVYYDIPFDPRNEIEMIRKQKNKEYKHKTQTQNTSDALKDLIDKLLDPNPNTRITSEGVLKHRWLSS